jgi:hypothetical protein
VKYENCGCLVNGVYSVPVPDYAVIWSTWIETLASMQIPMQQALGTWIICIFLTLVVLSIGSSADSRVLVLHKARPTVVLKRIQRLGEWRAQPEQPLVVQPLLPPARPIHPWPYRQLSSAKYVGITGSYTYALVATVQHAPLKGKPEAAHLCSCSL